MLKWMGTHAVSLQPLLLSSSSAFSKAFPFLPSELFLSDHTKIPSIPLPLFSSLLLPYFDSPVGSCQFRLVYVPFFLWFLPLLFSSPRSLLLLFHRRHTAGSGHPICVALANYAFVSTGTDLHTCTGQADTDKSKDVVCPSALPLHGSENLLRATCCSHAVALSFNTCLGFFGAPRCPQPLVAEQDEAIREAGKGTLHAVGKSRKQVQESGGKRGRGWRKRKITGWEAMSSGNLGVLQEAG